MAHPRGIEVSLFANLPKPFPWLKNCATVFRVWNIKSFAKVSSFAVVASICVREFHGAHQSFVLSETLSAGIKSLSHRHNVTLFTVLLAAFQTLLARYTGQTDIVIGSPIAGRNRGELEALIGFFLNMGPRGRGEISGGIYRSAARVAAERQRDPTVSQR